MSKVMFTFKTGRQRLANPRDAEVLRRLGQGTYLTRDMRANQEVPSPVQSDGLDGLDSEALHALAKERGVKVHPRAGAEKVRAALREAGR